MTNEAAERLREYMHRLLDAAHERSAGAAPLDALRNLVDAVTALEARAIRSSGEFHVWAEERMVTEARDEATALLTRLLATPSPSAETPSTPRGPYVDRGEDDESW